MNWVIEAVEVAPEVKENAENGAYAIRETVVDMSWWPEVQLLEKNNSMAAMKSPEPHYLLHSGLERELVNLAVRRGRPLSDAQLAQLDEMTRRRFQRPLTPQQIYWSIGYEAYEQSPPREIQVLVMIYDATRHTPYKEFRRSLGLMTLAPPPPPSIDTRGAETGEAWADPQEWVENGSQVDTGGLDEEAARWAEG